MGTRYYANAPATTLTSAISSSATSITVKSVTGLPVTFPFTLIIDRGQATEEVVEVTAAAGTTLTVTRGVDGTTAFAHALNAVVEHGISARDAREANEHINSGTAVHGLAGSVVGTTDTQTLTNKDLSSASNTFPATLSTDADLAAHEANTTTHGATGAVVGTTNTQTLTNKDLSSATNTFPAAFSPVGSVTMYAGATAPTGWLLCDGTAVSRTTYAALFAVVGTAFGAGDGSTTFNLPDLRNRTAVGASTSKALGTTGGSDTKTLGEAELPAHTHSINHDHPSTATSSDGSHAHTFPRGDTTGAAANAAVEANVDSTPNGTTNSAGAHTHTVDIPNFVGTSGSTGSAVPFSIQNPYAALNYIIRAA